MSELGVIVKDASEDVAQGAEKAGGAIIKHFGDVGDGLKESAKAYRGVEADTKQSMEKVLEGGAKDAEQAAAGVGKDTAQSVGNTVRNDTGQAASDAGKLGAETRQEEIEDAHLHGEGGATDDPIDVVTGEMFLPQTDLTLPGTLPLIVQRRHGSFYRRGRWFGVTWSSTLDQRVEIDEDGIHFAAADGRVLHYPVPSVHGQQVMASYGPRWPLRWDRKDDVITIEQGDAGCTLHFPPGPAPEVCRPLATVTDQAGNRITFVHDAEGVPTDVYHSGGYHLSLEAVETRGGVRISALKLADPQGDPDVTVRSYRYDVAGRLTGVVNSSGVPLALDYDEADRIVAWTDRNGYTYRYEYREDGRVVRAGGDDGRLKVELDYDLRARTTTMNDALGHATVYHWNELLHTVKVVDPLGHTTTSELDRYGQLLAATDPLDRTTLIERNGFSDALRVQWPDGSVLTTRYDEQRRPVETVQPDGALWSYTYSATGALSGIDGPEGVQARYQRDEKGRVTGYVDPLGNTTAIRCDQAGLPLEVTDALGAVTRLRRDRFGRVIEAADEAGAVTTIEWDLDGRPLARILPDASRETWRYDAEGNLLEHTDPAGAVTRFEYGPFDKVTARFAPDGTRHSFTYDAQMRLTEVTGPTGLTWTYTYDAAGRLISERDFNGAGLTYTLDAAGQLISRVDALGEEIAFDYDQGGRLIRKRAGQESSEFSYDAAGRLIGARGPGALLGYERDGLGRVVGETVNGRRVTSAYDAASRRIERMTPEGVVSRWSFDACGRPTALAGSFGSLSFQHDQAGRETVRMLGAGASLTRAYDELGRLTGLGVWSLDRPGEPDGGWHAIASRTYAYRADGLPERIEDRLRGPRTVSLDPAGRVTGVEGVNWRESYAYDPLGNLTEAETPLTARDAEAADGENAREYQGTLIKRAGRTQYEHDAAGRLVRRTRRTLSGRRLQWTFTWDAENRLTSASTPDGETWVYQYDPLGRRIAKQKLDADGGVAQNTLFAWDGPQLIEQTWQSGDQRASLTWDHEPDSFIPAAQTRRSWAADAPQEQIDAAFHAIVTDLVGTPMELVDGEGSLAWYQVRSLWGGGAVTAPDATAECPLRFPGQYEDAETGFFYNHHRYYDPDSGTYASADPLGLAPSPNPYAYVSNPLAWIDPLGLAAYDPVAHSDLDNKLTQAQAGATGKPPAVMARLDMDGANPIYGVNAHGVAYPRPAGVMPQSMGHAESHAFIQAAQQGLTGGKANLYVAGKIPCSFCRSSLAGWAKHLDLDELNVYSDGGYIGKYVRGGGFRTVVKGTDW